MSRRQRRGAGARPARAHDRLAEAVAHHQAGRLRQAEKIYRRILKAQPRHADALHLLGLVMHEAGRAEEALKLIERAIALDEGAPFYHYNLAEVLRPLGRAAEAEQAYRRAIALDARYADAHVGLGTALFDQGDAGGAVEHYRRALDLNPHDAEAWLNLGNAQSVLGVAEDAINAYRRAIALKPDYLDAHLNLAAAFRDEGETGEAIAAAGEAIAAAQEALRADPRSAAAHIVLAECWLAQGQLEEAEAAARNAVAIAPDDAIAMFTLGDVLKAQLRYDEAIACYDRAALAAPDLAKIRINHGNVLLDMGRVDEAQAKYEEAKALDPESAEAHYNLSICFRERGDFAGARAELERALDLRPHYASALAALATLRKYAPADREVEEIRRRLESESPSRGERVSLNFALGKIYDDLGRYDDAFAHFKVANDLENARLGFDPDATSAFFARLREVFDEAFFASRRGWGDPSELPVFILGMPRSGTTLVEQIVSSHPSVHGAGELRKLAEMAEALPGQMGVDSTFPGGVTDIDREVSARLGEAYLEFLRKRSGEAERVTDKMPHNFLRVGLIGLILPGARVIHCRRDPLDTCLSCYFQHFASRYPFAYDLENLGIYYRLYEELMEHWRRCVPLRMLDVRYEELVADLEGVSRRIVDFVGLDWDPSCLAFHENKRPVRTASQWQVRQPLYASSVGRWRRYAPYLGPLEAALRRRKA